MQTVQYTTAPPVYVQAPQPGAAMAMPIQTMQYGAPTQMPGVYAAAPMQTMTYGAAPIQQQNQVRYGAPPSNYTVAGPAPVGHVMTRKSVAPTMAQRGLAASVAEKPSWRVKLGAEMPNFHCETTHGDFTFHEFLDSDPECPHTILFSHPKDFTPVCTTELGRCEQLQPLFRERGVKLIGVSCDPVDEHVAWMGDILHRENIQKPDGPFLSFPIIADSTREIVTTLGMLDPEEMDGAGVPLPARALIVVGPDKKVKLSILYPATTGRNFDEVIRVIDSLQLTAGMGLATPVDWKQGDRCIVAPSVSTADAQVRFQNMVIEDLPSGKQYLRTVDCPQ